MYKNAYELLKAVNARKAADKKAAEDLKKAEPVIEDPIEEVKEEKKGTKKVKRENTKEFLVEEKEQPKLEVEEEE